MPLLILLITSIGYCTLLIVEPVGLKKFKTSRDILLKSFILGIAYSLILLILIISLKLKFPSYDSANEITQYFSTFSLVTLSWPFWITNAIWLIIIILCRCFKEKIDKVTFDYFLGNGDKTLRMYIGKIVVINVKPNRLYTGILKNFIDTDGEKGADFIELAPILSSMYDANGDVALKRYYNEDKSINKDSAHESTILIKFDEITQLREFNNELHVLFNEEDDSSTTSIARANLISRYNELSEKTKEAQESDARFKNLIEQINPLNFFEAGNDSEFITLEELKNIGKIPLYILNLYNELDDDFSNTTNTESVKEFMMKLLNFGDWIRSLLVEPS